MKGALVGLFYCRTRKAKTAVGNTFQDSSACRRIFRARLSAFLIPVLREALSNTIISPHCGHGSFAPPRIFCARSLNSFPHLEHGTFIFSVEATFIVISICIYCRSWRPLSFQSTVQYRLMALSAHSECRNEFPLSGVKGTSCGFVAMSARGPRHHALV